MIQQVARVGSEDVDPLPRVPDTSGLLMEFKGRPLVSTADGWLEIVRIQPEGRKSVDGRSFLNGYPLKPGDGFVAET
jgi:methionyl-tRNA formyltransferase